MFQYQLPGLARQRVAELQQEGHSGRGPREPGARHAPLRVRAGWTLVDLGLRMAVRRGPRPTTKLRPSAW